MNEADVFVLAEQTFAGVVDQVEDDQLGMRLPDWFELGGSQNRQTLSLRDILNYHAYDTAWIPDTFAGRSIEEVGARYDGDLLGDDVRGSYRRLAEAAVTAVRADFDPDRVVHFTYGDYPAREAITHPTSFRIFRAYDLAKLIGSDRRLPPELCDGFWAEVEDQAEFWRQMGIFKPALEVPAGADAQARLFALVGRDPDWQS